MVKQKLINKRKAQKLSQENMAFYMGITQSQYCRRENGITKISKNEWLKLAEILKTTLLEIYESEDDIYSIDETDSLFTDTNKEHLDGLKIETLAKYIQELVAENKILKEKVALLQSVIYY